MSSYPGPTLEDFVQDAWMEGADFAGVRRALEPMRKVIEDMLSDYLDDGGDAEHSWRDYRNGFLGNHEAEMNALLCAAGLHREAGCQHGGAK